MVLTQEMQTAFDIIENTQTHLYITGKAGTGKTTFLRYLIENTHKKMIVTAPTGIAAVNAGGTTLHSMFNIPLQVQNPNTKGDFRIPESKVDLYYSLDTIVIDEISMVRPDVLDYIDAKLRLCKMTDEPFGGVQIVMFGDLHQLPPVVKKEEKDILLQFYRGTYFFYSRAFIGCGFKMIEFTEVFRQSDQRFLDILNNIRNYRMTSKDVSDLDTLRDRRESSNYENKHIHICALKRDVQKINTVMLGTPTHQFVANITGDFPEGSAPCDTIIDIRVGARVMMRINDSDGKYSNGSMGNVAGIKNSHVSVLLDSGLLIDVSPYTWELNDYVLQDGEIKKIKKGTFTQLPISLAWAITIHKSQGLTFDNVVIHSNGIFASGQLYVALSRCRSMDGIITESFINNKQIIVDRELVAFNEAMGKNNNVFNRTTYRSLKLK